MAEIFFAAVFCYILAFSLLKILSAVLPDPQRVLLWVDKQADIGAAVSAYAECTLFVGSDDLCFARNCAARYRLLLWQDDIEQAQKSGYFKKIVMISGKNQKSR